MNSGGLAPRLDSWQSGEGQGWERDLPKQARSPRKLVVAVVSPQGPWILRVSYGEGKRDLLQCCPD